MSKAYTLKRKQIIRGFNRFNHILEKGQKVVSNNLTVFFLREENCPDRFLEVGFLISKKKIPKSHDRNYLKRLLRETYRMNCFDLTGLAGENKIRLCLLLSLSSKGYRSNKKLSFKQVDNDMKNLLNNEVTGLLKL